MSALTEFLNAASGIIWGPIMLVLLLGTGVFLTIGGRTVCHHSSHHSRLCRHSHLYFFRKYVESP